MSELIEIYEIEDKKILLEQYKVLLESINKLNDIREGANNWWVTSNAALLSIISYFRTIQEIEGSQRQVFLWTIICIGFILCYSWLSSILAIKKTIDKRNKMLLEFEKYFPAKTFTFSVPYIEGEGRKNSLTLKEAIVPLLCLVGYSFFALMLYFYPHLSAVL